MSIVATKMMVKARCRKSRAFSHSSSATLLDGGEAVVGQLHHKGDGLAAEGGGLQHQRHQNAQQDAGGIQADHHQGAVPGKNAAAKTA
jgi:hypothetical protein